MSPVKKFEIRLGKLERDFSRLCVQQDRDKQKFGEAIWELHRVRDEDYKKSTLVAVAVDYLMAAYTNIAFWRAR